MNTILGEQIVEQLKWRYATKQFDPTRKISAEDWATLEQSLMLTPSSFGLQPWKIVVVNDPETRRRLLPVSYGQRQVVDASHVVVFAIKKHITEREIDHYIDLIAEVRSVPRESLNNFRDVLIGGIINGMDDSARQAWAARQAYIGLGNFLSSAALMGIDACPMEGFLPNEFDQILDLRAQDLHAVVMVAAGYRAQQDKYAGLKKVRLPKEQVLMEI